MMEYLGFNFSLFEISNEMSNLVDFLNYIDKIDAFDCFENNLIPKMGYEIYKGLEYLHSKGIAHCDLKAKNILVSNQNYCNLLDEEARSEMFAERPVVCKLADFGESRSHLIQTAAALHSRTKNVDKYFQSCCHQFKWQFCSGFLVMSAYYIKAQFQVCHKYELVNFAFWH